VNNSRSIPLISPSSPDPFFASFDLPHTQNPNPNQVDERERGRANRAGRPISDGDGDGVAAAVQALESMKRGMIEREYNGDVSNKLGGGDSGAWR